MVARMESKTREENKIFYKHKLNIAYGFSLSIVCLYICVHIYYLFLYYSENPNNNIR